jgi:tetratricopeptide (TPR) repeat protein
MLLIPFRLKSALTASLAFGAVLLAVLSSEVALAQSPATSEPLPASSAEPSPPESEATTPLASRADASMFYQLLLAELSASRGEIGKAHSIFLDLAQKTGEAGLFERAYQLAFSSGQDRSASATLLLRTVQAWRQALPQSKDAIRAQLQVLIALNRLAGTLELLRAELALTSAKDKPAVIAQMPRYFVRAADKKMAATLVEQALSEVLSNPKSGAPNLSAAWLAISIMRLQAQNASGALTAAKLAQDQDPTLMGPAQVALELISTDRSNAETMVKRYLQSAPKPAVEVRMGLVRNWIQAQRLTEATDMLQAITREQSTYPDAWLLLGLLQVNDNQVDAAAPSLQRYLSLSTSLPAAQRQSGQTQAFLALSQIAEKKKDFPLAEAWLKRIEDTSELASAQIRRANLLAKQGKINEGRKLIRDLPSLSEADENLKAKAEFELLRDHKQYQAAYDWASQLRASKPADLEWLYEKAMMAEKLDRLVEMEQLLRQLITLKPDHHHAYNALGYSLADRNMRLTEAKELIQKALEFAPNDPFISDSLGWVEFRLGRHAEALKILQAAYKQRPDAEIAAHLGEVLWVMGQREQATKIWRDALVSEPDHESLLETLKRLRVKP